MGFLLPELSDMFDHLQISNARERYVVGLGDTLLRELAPLLDRRSQWKDGPVKRILLLRLERIGDLLMALRAIVEVRRLAPGAQIDLVVGSWNADLAHTIRDLDHVETLDVPWLARENGGATWSTLLSTAWTWRRRRYDLGINFEGDIRSNLLLGIAGATRRVGFAMRGGGPALTHPVEFSETAHTATNSCHLVRHAFGLEPDPLQDEPGRRATARLQIPEDARARAAALLEQAGATAMLIGIQASAGREIKQWDPGRFAEVGSVLAREYGATLVITGTADERYVTDRVIKGVDKSIRTIDFTADVDLLTMAGIIERMALFVTCDTGPMHLAAAVGTPTVAIFGPSLPSRYAPLLKQSRVVRIDLPCSPCNQLRRPPARCVGHIPDCLTGIEVEPVLAAARELMGPAGSVGQSITQASTQDP